MFTEIKPAQRTAFGFCDETKCIMTVMWRFAHVRPAVALWRFALARRARVHDSLKGLWEWLIQFGVVLLFVVWLTTICVTGECHDTQTEVFLCSRNLYYSFDKKPRHLSTKSRSLTFFCRHAVLRFPFSNQVRKFCERFWKGSSNVWSEF